MSQAVESTIYASDDSGFLTNPIALGVRDLDLLGDRTFGVVTGKRGTRQEYSCRARVMNDNVQGGFNIFPTDTELDWLVERAIGDNISGYPAGAAEPGETLPSFYVFADKGNVQTFQYAACRINRLTLSSSETQMLNCRVDLVGTTETEVSDVSSPPAVDCDSVLHHVDTVLSIGGSDFPTKSIELSIDNMIAEQYENSVTRSIFETQGLVVRLRVSCAYRSDTKALYRKAIAGDDTPTLVYSDGTNTYTITFGNIKIPGRGPTVPESGELLMPLELMAFATTSDPVLSIAKT